MTTTTTNSLREYERKAKKSQMCCCCEHCHLNPFLMFHASKVRSWLLICSTRVGNSAIVKKFNHDCTFKESLYSTHPYLTYSNKKSTLPVMTRFSIHGYREKIGYQCITAQVLWRRAALNIHSHSMPVNAI